MSFDLQPVLQSAILHLRPLKEEDREALFVVAADPLIWEQHPQKDRYQRDVFDAFFYQAIQSKGALLVTAANTGQVIGTSRYYDWKPAEKSVVIGYTFLARACWGRGYNRDLKTLMLEHAFRTADVVYFHIGEHNVRSRKAIEKIGAQLCGRLDKQNPDGSPNPSVIYQLIRKS